MAASSENPFQVPRTDVPRTDCGREVAAYLLEFYEQLPRTQYSSASEDQWHTDLFGQKVETCRRPCGLRRWRARGMRIYTTRKTLHYTENSGCATGKLVVRKGGSGSDRRETMSGCFRRAAETEMTDSFGVGWVF